MLQKNTPSARARVADQPRRFRMVLALAWLALAWSAPAPVSAQTPTDAERVLPRPMRTALRLAEGDSPLRGEVLAWSELGVRFLPQGEEFDRLILWYDLQPAAAYELRRRLIDRSDAQGWLGLGVLMLEMGDLRRAEQALGVATRLDEALKPVADRARELPTWANEGLADYIAGFVVRSSPEPNANWTKAKEFVLQGRNPREIMQQSYRDGSWPGDYSYQVSHMLVRFLLKHKPREFKSWIDAIKAGAKWEEALEAHFGVAADVLAQGFADAIRNEPHYAP